MNESDVASGLGLPHPGCLGNLSSRVIDGVAPIICDTARESDSVAIWRSATRAIWKKLVGYKPGGMSEPLSSPIDKIPDLRSDDAVDEAQ